MTDLIETLLAENRSVVSFPIHEYWLDIGQHTDYLRAQEDIKNGSLFAIALSFVLAGVIGLATDLCMDIQRKELLVDMEVAEYYLGDNNARQWRVKEEYKHLWQEYLKK